MKIDKLLMDIRNKDFNLERGLQVKKYLPMEVKKTIAQGIIYECTTEEDGVIKLDSVQRYLSYVKYMITMHTNLEYTDNDYDKLCSTKYKDTTLLNAIVSTFDSDANECNRILDLMMDDYMQEVSLEFVVAKFLNNMGARFNNMAESINNKISNIDLKSIIPENFDFDQFNTLLDKYGK